MESLKRLPRFLTRDSSENGHRVRIWFRLWMKTRHWLRPGPCAQGAAVMVGTAPWELMHLLHHYLSYDSRVDVLGGGLVGRLVRVLGDSACVERMNGCALGRSFIGVLCSRGKSGRDTASPLACGKVREVWPARLRLLVLRTEPRKKLVYETSNVVGVRVGGPHGSNGRHKPLEI